MPLNAAVVTLVAVAPLGVAGLPAGFTTWFYATNGTFSCSDMPGWQEFVPARGRMLVSVANANESLVAVNAPLSNQEDRIHSHSYAGSINLPSHHVAAIDCCNNDGAANGNYPISGTSNPATSGLAFAQLLLCSLINDDATLAVPFGTVAYFPNASACPAPWSPYTEAAGRALVPQNIPSGGLPVVSADPPLASGEDRTHAHTVAAQVDVPDVEYAGVDGCCNDNPTSSGAIAFDAPFTPASAALPYLQALSCLSADATFNASLPPNAMYFNPTLNCNGEWVLAAPFAGRFLVALPAGGAANAMFGGTPLSANDTASVGSAHTFAGSLPLPPTGVGLASGCCADGYGRAGTAWYAGTSDASPAGMPFMQLPLCWTAAAQRAHDADAALRSTRGRH